MSKTYKAMHWLIEPASREFGCDGETLSKALKRAGIEPAFKDGSFSTTQIVSALFGDYDAQRTRKVTAEADLLEITKAEKRRELISSQEFVEIAQRGLQAMTAHVMSITELPIEQRESIIKQIRACGESVVEGVGDRNASA